ncbi:hypothetical protein GGE65_001300 [Skermanella aerolata]|jgi:hypothetical protein|uniref:hypothetical protein n=1 Tax=Skermanella aerolata TaxID=393310 RepID=UPI003D204BA2
MIGQCKSGMICCLVVVILAVLPGCTKQGSEIETVISAGPPHKSAALAVVPQQGRRFWHLAVADHAADARRNALTGCANPLCKVVHEYAPGDCAIVVQGQDQVFWGREPSETIGEILDYCNLQTRSCQLVRHECLQ